MSSAAVHRIASSLPPIEADLKVSDVQCHFTTHGVRDDAS